MRKYPLLLVLALAGCGSAPSVTADPVAPTITRATTVLPTTTEADSAEKGKTEDQLVSAGFTEEQAACITDGVWDKIPRGAPAQVDCITGKLTDADLVNVMDGEADALTAAVTSCLSSG